MPPLVRLGTHDASGVCSPTPVVLLLSDTGSFLRAFAIGADSDCELWCFPMNVLGHIMTRYNAACSCLDVHFVNSLSVLEIRESLKSLICKDSVLQSSPGQAHESESPPMGEGCLAA